MQRRGLAYGRLEDLPRLSFWIDLCRAAAFLDEAEPPRPTLLVVDWLGWPLDEQLEHLLQAWVQSPTTPVVRALRRQVLEKLAQGDELSADEISELDGLAALGLVRQESLSDLGHWILSGAPRPALAIAIESWEIVSDRLITPYPPDWGLLWELEAYLDPSEPGVYPLTQAALQRATQRGQSRARDDLPAIFERGLGAPPLQNLLDELLNQPVIRVLPGPVLKFDQTEDLLELRRSPFWRKETSQVLSPRHVHLDPWRAPGLLRRLLQKGLLTEADLDNLGASPGAMPKTNLTDQQNRRSPYLSIADRAYLLSLLLLAAGLPDATPAPPGLLAKLANHLDEQLRASAARRASAMLAKLLSTPAWVHEEEPPQAPEEKLLESLSRAIHQEESIDVLYRANRRALPEFRHISPLLIEQRGPRWYLIAYCHMRRANRTFRLDRLQLIDHPVGV